MFNLWHTVSTWCARHDFWQSEGRARANLHSEERLDQASSCWWGIWTNTHYQGHVSALAALAYHVDFINRCFGLAHPHQSAAAQIALHQMFFTRGKKSELHYLGFSSLILSSLAEHCSTFQLGTSTMTYFEKRNRHLLLHGLLVSPRQLCSLLKSS